jgi:hypothetical protein
LNCEVPARGDKSARIGIEIQVKIVKIGESLVFFITQPGDHGGIVGAMNRIRQIEFYPQSNAFLGSHTSIPYGLIYEIKPNSLPTFLKAWRILSR